MEVYRILTHIDSKPFRICTDCEKFMSKIKFRSNFKEYRGAVVPKHRDLS